MLSARPVFVLGVLHVRQPFEPLREPTSHLIESNESRTPWVRPSWRFEDAIVHEESHDPVEVVRVERSEQFHQHFRASHGRHTATEARLVVLSSLGLLTNRSAPGARRPGSNAWILRSGPTQGATRHKRHVVTSEAAGLVAPWKSSPLRLRS